MVLAADVVSYSTLMCRDGNRKLARHKAHRLKRPNTALVRHRGRLVGLSGHGSLAELPGAVDPLGAVIECQQANRDQPEEI